MARALPPHPLLRLVVLVAPALLVIGSLVSGCYLAHERATTDRGDASPLVDAGRADVDAAAADAGLDAQVRACTWSPSGSWQLTSPPGDQTLHDVAAVPDGFLIVTGSANDPPVEVGRFAHRVSVEGPLAERTTVFPSARGTFFGGVSLAVGPTTILASTWDDAGCYVRTLDLTGTPIAPPAGLPIPSCSAPFATGDGFALFDRPTDQPAAVHQLDATSTRIASSGPVLDVLDSVFWWSRARLFDGSLLLTTMRDGVSPTRALAQRVDASGAPLGPIVDLPPFLAASRIRAIATGRGALVAWLENLAGDEGSQERAVRVFSVDEAGHTLSSPITVSGALPAYRDAGLSLAPIDGGVLLAYVESGDAAGRSSHVVLLRLEVDGRLVERLDLLDATFARTPLVRTRGNEAIIAYTASGSVPTQVFVAGLACR